MGIFSRRIVKRFLEENRRFLSNAQINRHIRHLNGSSSVQRLTTEWEVAILNVLYRLGLEPEYEPRLDGATSAPDVLVRHEGKPALIEVTTASDRGLDDENPYDRLSEELIRRLSERGLDPNKFALKIEGNWRELHLGGPKPRLLMPRACDFERVVFDDNFYHFLDQVAASGRKASLHPPADANGGVLITYDPAQQFFGGSHLDYTVAFTGNKNPVYNRLDAKASQLKKTGFKGFKGIILCDGACGLLAKNGRRGIDLGVNEIIFGFLQSEPQIDFVLVLRVKSDGSNLLGPEHLKITAEMFVGRADLASDSLITRLRSIAQGLPPPETTPVNGYSTENAGKSFYGGGTMAGHKIKMSARAVLGVLSGQTKQEDFARDNDIFVEALRRMTSQGRVISDAKIEHVPERDDDWIEFTFSEPDPAAGSFELIQDKAP